LRPKTTPIQKTPYLNYKKKEIPIKDEKLSTKEDINVMSFLFLSF